MREAMGHTQLSLAVAIGCNPMAVSKWERGVCEPLPVFFKAVNALYAAYRNVETA
jgi:transcriptional regulator with XRE-family HTH domain